MFNEHVYRCSLNNKRTILYISAENQQANKLCKILSFHVRRFFWALCCALQNILYSGRYNYKKKQLEQHVNFESGRWFLCSYTHSKVCVRVLNSLHPCVGEFESLFHSKKQMRDFETNGMNRGWANKVWVDEKGENRLQRGKEFDIHRWLRQFHVAKLQLLSDIKKEKR